MSMLTELDLTIDEIAEIYCQKGWYPASNEDADVEGEIRSVLRMLLREIVKTPEASSGLVETMRLRVQKDPDGNFAQLYLNIGTVEW